MAKVVSRVKGDKVYIAVGAGTKPIEVTWQQGDTVDSVLKRADVIYTSDKSPTLGKVRVLNPKNTHVKPGDTIVVAGRPANG